MVKRSRVIIPRLQQKSLPMLWVRKQVGITQTIVALGVVNTIWDVIQTRKNTMKSLEDKI